MKKNKNNIPLFGDFPEDMESVIQYLTLEENSTFSQEETEQLEELRILSEKLTDKLFDILC